MALGTGKPLFVHLRVHSAYSLLEGALPIPKLADLARLHGIPALALTDTNNLFGALAFSEAMAASGIQPIIGCTLSVAFEEADSDEQANGRPARARAARGGALALLAKDQTGYANLMKLSSIAYLDRAEEGDPHVTLADIARYQDGLIALTGGPDGAIDRALLAGENDLAAARLRTLLYIFGDRLYVELQRHGRAQERAIEPRLIELAYQQGLPLVAANQAYFAERGDFEAHDALICIAEGAYISSDERRRLTPEHHFKSAGEMVNLFGDLPEAIAHTIEIARRCAFRPVLREPILPRSISAEGQNVERIEDEEASALRRQAEEGLRARLAREGTAPGIGEDAYWRRIEEELRIVNGMHYAGYFLIVADFIKWAKSEGIPVGPGRGSGAGSLVAWALTITDLDPLRFGLLFERFLNPERVSMPDFDIDFCQERRDEVIRYVRERYGADRVAQIITFGKLQARAVLRDVGRVLQIPYGQVDRLCKLVPYNPANPVRLAEAIAGEPRLQEARAAEPIVARLLDIALKLEGLYRHASTHAAGVVIGDRPLTELVPLYRDARAELPATQFNMKWVEAAGLVKFDFLGLKTLSVIEHAKRLIARDGIEIDLARLPLDDAKTFEMLARGETVGVFQLESSGMRDALRKLKPDRFEDIIAIVALYRPGPMDNIETYVNRKHGREKPDYLHDLIRPILEETYGVIIYQEQVMQIAQVLSGYSLGEADLLRRAMGKKIKKEMDEQRSRFVSGALDKGVEEAQAEYIFDLVAKFAGYGFNKSHAAAYALIAYQTAYLKANYPVALLAASMSFDMVNTDKLNIFVQEARRSGIAIEPPCVNASEAGFAPEGNAIRYALAALRNMGRGAADALTEERRANGPFESIADFARRANPRSLTKRAIEGLAAAGAFDALDPDRATVHANAELILAAAARAGDEKANGQTDLFGNSADSEMELQRAEPWPPIERLAKEFDTVGFFLSGHPLDEYDGVLVRERVQSWNEFAAAARKSRVAGNLAGTVTYRQERRSRTGNRFAFVGFSDRTGQFEAVVFSETLAATRDVLEPGKAVLVKLEAEPDEDTIRTRLLSVESLDAVAMRHQDGLKVVVRDADALGNLAARLPQGPGELRVVLRLDDIAREVEFEVPGRFDTSPAQASALRQLAGVISVEAI